MITSLVQLACATLLYVSELQVVVLIPLRASNWYCILPVQDLDPLPVVYTGIIPYAPYGRTLYQLPLMSISRPDSTLLRHPQSTTSDPRLWISCNSARTSTREAMTAPKTKREPRRLTAGDPKSYIPNHIVFCLSVRIPYCQIWLPN